MVAFCAPAAIVPKVCFRLIAIVSPGWAGGLAKGERPSSTQFWVAVLMRLADVQVYCGEGGASSKRWCLFLFVRCLGKTETDT
ncbi:Secreted protein [Pseudomonas sp. IT-194MI4]